MGFKFSIGLILTFISSGKMLANEILVNNYFYLLTIYKYVKSGHSLFTMIIRDYYRKHVLEDAATYC